MLATSYKIYTALKHNVEGKK